MFNFKLPIFDYTREFIDSREAQKKNALYGKDYIVLDSFEGKKLVRLNDGTIAIEFSYATYPLERESQNLVKDWILDEDIIKTTKAALAECFNTNEYMNVPAINVICPYTWSVINVLDAHISDYFITREIEVNYRDSSGELNTDIVTFSTFGEVDVMKINTAAIKKYYRSSPLDNTFYSDEVLALFKAEWGFDNTVVSGENNLDIMADDITKAKIYYTYTDSNESKLVYLNFEKGRYVKIKGKAHYLGSPEIEDFDKKLREVRELGAENYIRANGSNDSFDKKMGLIINVMNRELSSEEKINAIAKIIK